MLALLNFNYVSRFFGQDILAEGRTHQRAVMANYQTVGYYEHGMLVELRPQRRVHVTDAASGRELPPSEETRHFTNEAIGYYQGASSASVPGLCACPAPLPRAARQVTSAADPVTCARLRAFLLLHWLWRNTSTR